MKSFHVSRLQLRNFIRRARRRYPDEYIETIWGRKGSSGTHQICSFQNVDHDATPFNITDWDEADMPNGQQHGNLVCLGTIHSHPNISDASPSEDDWDFFRQEREIVSAICLLTPVNGKLKSRVRWFISQAMIDVEYGK